MDFRGKGDRMEAAEIEALQQQNKEMAEKLAAAEAAKGGDDSADELKRLKELNAELIAGRDKAKEAKRAAEEAALKEQGEFKTLSEQLAEEKKALEEQLAGQAETLGKIKERDEAKLQTLKDGLPDNYRALIEKSTAPLSERIELAETLTVDKPAAPAARPAGPSSQSSLKEQHAEAVRTGNVELQIALKRQMFEE